MTQIEAAPASAPPHKTARAPRVLAAAVAAAALVGLIVYVLQHGKESTDDAQVEGHIVSVAARVQGQVARVLVKDNQEVKEGDLLLELDPADLEARLMAARADLASAQAGLSSAEAQLALTERNIDANLTQARGSMTQASSGWSSSVSAVDQARADLSAAEARHRLARQELDRARVLRDRGASSAAELDTRQSLYDQAVASLSQAQARLQSATVNTTGSVGAISVARGRLVAAETGPQQVQAARAAVDLGAARIKQAEAALRLAELGLSYTKIHAPQGGVVARKSVEVGQMVGPERALLALVPLNDVWVVANFKEDQLFDMKPGQRAAVQVDTFGRRSFSGRVDSIAGATGARFSLLPPDNASGNFVKVAQRIPVLLRLDGGAGVMLRPGMSANVTVYTR